MQAVRENISVESYGRLGHYRQPLPPPQYPYLHLNKGRTLMDFLSFFYSMRRLRLPPETSDPPPPLEKNNLLPHALSETHGRSQFF